MPPKKNAKDAKAKAKQDQKRTSRSTSKAKAPQPQPVKSGKAGKAGKAGKTASKDLDNKKSPAKSPAKKPSIVKDTSVKKKDKSPSPEPKGKRGKADPPLDSKPAKKTKSDENIVKVVTKGGAAVDSIVSGKQNYRVHQQGGKVYSATLNQANLDHNNNKFYIIQVLVNQTNGAYSVWNRWGRVGVEGQHVMKPMGNNKDAAIRDYNNKYNDKTKSGNYIEIEIKYDDQDKKQDKKVDNKPKKDIASKIDPGLQKLISLIFDVQVMNNTMKQIGYDAKKMPLGRLGDTTVKQAYTVLNQISKAIKKKDTTSIKDLSGKFYSLIPHDFGFQKMANFILDNDQKIKQKIKMLQAISDMKITTKLLDQKSDDDLSVLDQNYKKLGCQIKTVNQQSLQYKLLKDYLDNTKGHYQKVKVGQIYQVCRPAQQKIFNDKLGNNMLLWHGSRISNFVGILSQGLRIAPPQAPVSGYLFGKGIYLADLAQKSINYCRSHGSDKALILLIQGALGQPNVLLQSNYQAKELMQQNKKHSTKCHGAKAPPQSSFVKHKNMIVPKGKPTPTGSGSYMGHNEFIVYNMNQARIRYIIQMDMNGS